MNTKVKQEWIKALRSGEYKQGRNFLARHTNEGLEHCCLGVLCELAVKEGICEKRYDHKLARYYFDDIYSTLPSSVRDWLNFKDKGSQVIKGLMEMNDTLRNSFKQIADYVETID